MSARYEVEIRESGQWVPQGDGPMGKATAQRVAREVAHDFGIRTRIVRASERHVPPCARVMGCLCAAHARGGTLAWWYTNAAEMLRPTSTEGR